MAAVTSSISGMSVSTSITPWSGETLSWISLTQLSKSGGGVGREWEGGLGVLKGIFAKKFANFFLHLDEDGFHLQ